MKTRVPIPKMDAETLSALAVVFLLAECEKPKGRQKLERARNIARSEAGRSRVIDFRNGKTPEEMLAALDRAGAMLDLVLAVAAERGVVARFFESA